VCVTVVVVLHDVVLVVLVGEFCVPAVDVVSECAVFQGGEVVEE